MSSYRTLGLSLALFAFTFVAYWPVTRAGFIWDDDDHLTANPAMTAPNGLRMIWSSLAVSRYYPLTLTSFWLEHRIWGLKPLPYHLVNVLLHAINGILVFLVLRRLRIPAAWLAAMLWVLHPVNVESAAWITEQKNTQSGLFFLLAILCFLRFEDKTERRWYLLALLCGLAAMLSKPSTVVLPVVLLLCVWWRRNRWQWMDLTRTAPFFGLALGMSALTIMEQRGHIDRTGASGWTLGEADRLIVASKDLWFYVGKLLWPVPLTFVYPRWEVRADSLSSWLPSVALIAVGLVLWARRKQDWARAALFGIGFFVVALLPVLGFFDVFYFQYSFVADHFQYLASIGVIALAVAAGTTVSLRAGQQGWYIRTLGTAIVLLILGACTWRQAHIFQDPETLWRDTLAKNPDCWMAHNNFGMVLASQNKAAAAMAEYTTALKIKPDFADPHNNLGTIFAARGEVAKAAVEFTEAARLKPNLADAHENLGKLLAGLGKAEEAVAEYQTALRIDPGAAEVRNDLGITLASLGRVDEAIAEYQIALRIKPNLAGVYFNLAGALMAQNRFEEAVAAYRTELRIGPDDAEVRNGLGIALMHQGNVKEAISEYEQAVLIKPGFAGAHYNLGSALASQRNFAEALTEYREAVRLEPDWAPAVGSLAWLLATAEDANLRNGAEAVQLGERFCQMTYYQQADALVVLAAAYAEVSRFPEAVQSAQKAIELARANGQQGLAAQAQEQLKLYQQGRRLREKPALPSPP